MAILLLQQKLKAAQVLHISKVHIFLIRGIIRLQTLYNYTMTLTLSVTT